MKTDRQPEQSPMPHHERAGSRREFLTRAGGGFGALGLAYLLGLEGQAADQATRPSSSDWRIRPRAKSVIFLFMEGGPSQLDTFDPKPLLNKLAGQKLPPSFKPVITPMGEGESPLLPSRRTWKQHGQSGLWVSDWLPHMATCVDDLTVIRSCVSDGLNHVNGVCQMNTGSILGGRPSLGSWVTYGLGSANNNLPAYVVIQDVDKAAVAGGPRNWGAGFMPAAYQGTKFLGAEAPVANLAPPPGVDRAALRSKLDYLGQLNARHAEARPEQSELDARIQSFELAYRMQAEAPEAVDLSQESEETRELYGLNRPSTATFGRNCLLARRLVERGVRFVQLYHGAGARWDAHSGIEKNHTEQCLSSDQPVAALIHDLKRRGLLDETLVIWGGEFGRTPMSEKGDGRDHNPYGFTMCLAGAGLPGGRVIGSTDELGLHAVEDRIHVHDLHASILHLLGLDHEKLVYLHKGRPERATMNEGIVVEKLLAQA